MRGIKILGNKGQNTAEYAIVIALVVAAAIAMQTYVKRGLQGRVHDASDRYYDKMTGNMDAEVQKGWDAISSTTATALASKQYEPEKFESKATQEMLEDEEKSTMAEGGAVTRESIERTKQSDKDYQKYDY